MKLVLPPLFLVVVIGLVALCSVWAQQAWLAPSIAAAAFTQLFTPNQPGARPYTIVLGQLIGAAAGFVGVYAAQAAHAGKMMGDHDITTERALAVIIAVALTSVLQMATEARSPAGGTTAVVIAVGAETADLGGALRLAGGILLVAVLGEIARRILVRVMPSEQSKPSPPA